MRLRVEQQKCVSKLGRGEGKRWPLPGRSLLGWYFGCPSCGLSMAILAGEQEFEEHEEGDELVVTMRPGFKCGRCGATFSIDRGEIRVA